MSTVLYPSYAHQPGFIFCSAHERWQSHICRAFCKPQTCFADADHCGFCELAVALRQCLLAALCLRRPYSPHISSSCAAHVCAFPIAPVFRLPVCLRRGARRSNMRVVSQQHRLGRHPLRHKRRRCSIRGTSAALPMKRPSFTPRQVRSNGSTRPSSEALQESKMRFASILKSK
jgi:hypothetical protein